MVGIDYIGKVYYLCIRYNEVMIFPPNITLPYDALDLLDRITQKKLTLDSKRPLSAAVVDRLKADFALEWTYNSTNIEGNTLSIAETRLVLEDGITVGGKTLREHFEVINHDKAITYLESILDTSDELRVIDILSLHELVMTNILDDHAGRLRQGMVRIVGANFTPPNARKVPDMLDELVDYCVTNPQGLDPIVLATLFHHRFVWIHPFTDGNGRTVRLAMNLILMRLGYPPCYILTKDRKKYISALNKANAGDYSKLLLLILQSMERSLNLYINAIGGDYEDYEPISTIVEDPEIPYGQEYVSLLARRGRIDAYKEGRVWLTTKSAIMNYQAGKLK